MASDKSSSVHFAFNHKFRTHSSFNSCTKRTLSAFKAEVLGHSNIWLCTGNQGLGKTVGRSSHFMKQTDKTHSMCICYNPQHGTISFWKKMLSKPGKWLWKREGAFEGRTSKATLGIFYYQSSKLVDFCPKAGSLTFPVWPRVDTWTTQEHPMDFLKWTQGKKASHFLAEGLRGASGSKAPAMPRRQVFRGRVRHKCRCLAAPGLQFQVFLRLSINPALPEIM